MKRISVLCGVTILRLYNSVPDNGESNIFLSACSALIDNDVACVSVREVMDAVSGLKTAKSVGPNGLASESFTFSGVKLSVHLSLLYTFCVIHGYLLDHFMDINIIPLVKNKCGDLTDMNNYRAIALSNVETKVLEKIILTKVVTHSDVENINLDLKRSFHYTLC